MILSDVNLSRRLERAEAHASSRFVEARARMSPDSGAEWMEVAGAYAMFDGPKSPITQTFGLGMFEEVTDSDLDRLEGFFKDRGAPVMHEISPLAHKSLFTMLTQRGYQPLEFTSVMFLPLNGEIRVDPPANAEIHVRAIGEEDSEVWANTAAEGWKESIEFADLILDLARVSANKQDGPSFLAELDGRPIAAGSLSVHEGVALFAGASTIPEARRQGAQRALLAVRLRHAQQTGCDLAMMCAEPGSTSQRNAERHGFRIAYTRIKWTLP